MMKKVVLITSFTFFVLTSRIVTAIDWIEVNGSKETVVSQVGQKFLLTSNVSTAGAKLACYFFLDVNNNRKIDSIDKLVNFYLLTDGIGNIIDKSTLENIPGDEAAQPGLISTTLFTHSNQCPPSSQNWIIKAVDDDRSENFAYVKWSLNERDCVVTGSIKNTSKTRKAGHVIYAVESGFPGNKKIATVNSLGEFELFLEPNSWQIYGESMVYPFAPSLSQEIILHDKERVDNLKITFPGKDYFAAEMINELKMPGNEIVSTNYSNPQNLLKDDDQHYFSNYEILIENAQSFGIDLQESQPVSIDGLVLIGPETPAQNINIVAKHEWEKGPIGYLFTKTNEQGRFRLETEIEGDWKIGVASDEFEAHPGIQYCYLSGERKISNLIFNLLPKPKKMLPAENDFRASLNSK
jgi:hypothetical protein